ncbi:MAG: hypothetical protein ABSE74_06350 [Methanoregula sp.]|jgi:hypothetical protein
MVPPARLLQEKEHPLAPISISVRSLLVESEYGDIVRGITGTATRERASLIVTGARCDFAAGNLKGANALPMRRQPTA